MKKLLFLFLILSPSWVLACMPPFPWEVMVGRISSMNQSASGYVNIRFSSFEFPFKNYEDTVPTSWHWQNYSDTSYPWFWTGELIIVLSDYQDGSYPMNHSIFHMTTLSCENDTLKLGKRYGTVMWWNRKTNDCSAYEAKSLLDVFIDGDESIWIKKLQEKYSTCDGLQRAFPIKQEISSNNTNVPSLEYDVSIQSTWFPWLDWIVSKIDTFFGLL